jgi:parallel beta-helix repeat protein
MMSGRRAAGLVQLARGFARPGRRVGAVLAGLIAAGAVSAAVAAPPAPPSREAIDQVVAAVQALPLPAPVEGELRVAPASEERRLRRSFLDVQAAQPGWRDEGIVVASGVHRLEAVAESIDRPDLLTCDERLCRLTAPLAVESGATLVIDQLTLELEQSSGAALIAFGDLFLSLATVLGRDGERLAVTDGPSFRPFVVAYDGSRTVVRDSRFAALGYDSFGTTGLSFLTASRDDPAGHPEVQIVASMIEDVFEGVFVRGGGRVEIARNIITGSGRHGVVLRDGTRQTTIVSNAITASGAAAENGNGIVVSRGVLDAAIADNTIEGSAASAILVNNGSIDVTISGNTMTGSGRDALVIYESQAIDVARNTIVGNGRSGIRVRASDGIRVEENALRDNARAGLDLHDWSTAAREPNEEEAALSRPTVVTATGNIFSNNARGDCLVEGVVTVLPDGDNDC